MTNLKKYVVPKVVIPSEATQERIDLKSVRVALHGLPMSGKSTFVSELGEKVLCIALDPNLDHIKCRKIPCESFKHFSAIVDELENLQTKGNLHETVELISIDTVGLLYLYCDQAACEELGISNKYDQGGKYTIAAWTLIKERWCEMLMRLVNLNVGIIFVGHTDMKEVGIGYNKTTVETINLSPAPMSALSTVINVSLQIAYEKKGKENVPFLKTEGSRIKLPEKIPFVQGEAGTLFLRHLEELNG